MFLKQRVTKSAFRLPSNYNSTKTLIRTRTGIVGKKESIPRVTGTEVHWQCREGERPIIIDARPKPEYDLFHIMGTLNIPATTVKNEDIADIPQDRPVFVCSGQDTENLAIELAERIIALNHPRVSIITGGTDVIRQTGFLYYKDFERYDKFMEELRVATEATRKQ